MKRRGQAFSVIRRSNFLTVLLAVAGISIIGFGLYAAAQSIPPVLHADVCEDTDISGDAFIGHDHPNTTCGHYVSFGFNPPTTVSTSLQRVARGASGAVDIAVTPVTDDTRLFLVGQGGKIYLSNKDDADVSGSVFLDLTSKVLSGGERGLLGLAFDPNYAQNGYFYVFYTSSQSRGTFNGQAVASGDTIVSRFTKSSTNANQADPNSELVILGVDDPESNHNGGGLHFGSDGYLYISIGDGGGGGDGHTQNCAYGNGQCLNTYMGKILRLDVAGASTSERYKIPAGNPFIGQSGAKPEIWHYGLRNPWRFSFDSDTGDMFIGDVGQNAWEEVDLAPAGSKGLNFGWRCYEGNHTYDFSGNSNCSNTSLFTNPIHEYGRGDGCSITGGYIYRGAAHPEFDGTYIYGDYCTSDIWYLTKNVSGTWQRTQTVETGFSNGQLVAFGVDQAGEIYMAILAGNVYKLSVSH